MDKLLASQIVKANTRLDDALSNGGLALTASDPLIIESGHIGLKTDETLAVDINGKLTVAGGGGEEWEDVPFEVSTTTPPSETDITYLVDNDLWKAGTYRFTVLHGSSGPPIKPALYSSFVVGLYDAVGGTKNIAFPTNTVYNAMSPSTFTGMIKAYVGTITTAITYVYGVTITTETARPGILKIERLKENE